MGQLGKTAAALDVLTGGSESKIQLDTTLAASHSAGLLSYDATSKTILADTGFPDVRVNVGQETQIRFFNNTGGQIDNGTAINVAGVNAANDVFIGIKADASSVQTSSAVIGMATHDVPDQTIGIATNLGEVRGFSTAGLPEGGVIYLSETAGELTATRPVFPSNIVIMGSVVDADADGIFFVDVVPFTRVNGGKSYSFRSSAGSAGYNYVGGFYDAPSADTTLTQAATTDTHGVTGVAYSAHAFAVFGGAGTVDAGQVGLRVNGASVNDAGTYNGTDTEDITDDITTLSLNQYIETSKKWVGQVTYELFEVSPAGTYSVDFNYGFAKYEDLGNNDFTVTDFEVVGVAGATDTSFNMRLLKHSNSGWTYSAGAFIPGDGSIIDWFTDMGAGAGNDNLTNGENFAWKRDNLSEFVDGDGSEGVLVEIFTGANGSVQSMDVHIGAQLEELVVT